MVRKKLFLLLLFFLTSKAEAQERIKLFDADITVNQDGSLHITETIEVQALGDQIKHGIVREFPTLYKNSWGTAYHIPLNIITITLDTKEIPYRLEKAVNGIRIYIGDKNLHLLPGTYTFVITYKTNRQLGFFEKHDELYWNVTGNGWRLPIDLVQAKINLPKNCSIQNIEGYTGVQGSKGQDYTATIDHDTATFTTTKPLRPYEGFTTVATWPKGIITKPSFVSKIIWFLSDNLILLISFLIMLILLGITIFSWRLKNTHKPGTIIPHFYPPSGLNPSTMGFISYLKYKDVFLSADIVHLAIQGFITITHEKEKKFFSSNNKYILTATNKEQTNLSYHDQILLSELFASSNTISLTKDNQKLISKLKSELEKEFSMLEQTYLHTNPYYWFTGLLLGIAFLITLPEIHGGYLANPLSTLFLSLSLGLTLLVGTYLHKTYSPDGRILKDEIDGFKMYLETTETERLKVIGTPPTKTPELFEAYLPYAMVLGVEDQWRKQFTKVFEHLNQEKKPYVGIWISSNHFGNSFSSVITSTISSSSYIPGFSSGSDNKGSSGGGGGGGGGGGW